MKRTIFTNGCTALCLRQFGKWSLKSPAGVKRHQVGLDLTQVDAEPKRTTIHQFGAVTMKLLKKQLLTLRNAAFARTELVERLLRRACVIPNPLELKSHSWVNTGF